MRYEDSFHIKEVLTSTVYTMANAIFRPQDTHDVSLFKEKFMFKVFKDITLWSSNILMLISFSSNYIYDGIAIGTVIGVCGKIDDGSVTGFL